MADERSKVADKPDILEKPDILRVPAPAPLVTFPVDVVVPEGRQQTPAVGQRASRADGRLHGLGQTKYIDDMYFPNMLFAKIKRAGVASAIIKSIDTKEAAAMPGVVAIITGRDIPCNSFGPSLKDQPVLADTRVFHAGDGVAAVAAETEQIATEALEKIKVEYEVLKPVLDPLESLKLETPGIHAPSANIYGHKIIKKGDVEKAFKESDSRAGLAIQDCADDRGVFGGVTAGDRFEGRALEAEVVWGETITAHFASIHFTDESFTADGNFIEAIRAVYNERTVRTEFRESSRFRFGPFCREDAHHLCARARGICQRAEEIHDCLAAESFPRARSVTHGSVRQLREKESDSNFFDGCTGALNRNIYTDAERFEDVRRAALRAVRAVAVFRDAHTCARCDEGGAR